MADKEKNVAGNEYNAAEIQVLEGLEAVRKRPGMYIGSTSASGLHHLVYEIVDNSIDEALAGFCTDIHVTINDGNTITVKGKNGTLTREIHPAMHVAVEGNTITVSRPNDEKQNRALHGLSRSLINNMVIGVTEGFQKVLEVNGVGYRVSKSGKTLTMNLGYSHPVTFDEIDGITITVEGTNKIIISGPDKQKVGQFAAEVREKRPPEPYKGKGIKYADEHIRRKEGKTGAKKK